MMKPREKHINTLYHYLFHIAIKLLYLAPHCGKIRAKDEGTITSPNYPEGLEGYYVFYIFTPMRKILLDWRRRNHHQSKLSGRLLLIWAIVTLGYLRRMFLNNFYNLLGI